MLLLIAPTLLLSLSITCSRSAGTERKAGEQALLYYLMTNYNSAVRPSKNASEAIQVQLGLTLTNIFDMDEKNQVLVTGVWLEQQWHDELMQWDPAQFDGKDSIRIPCEMLWRPDIVLYNNADDYTGYLPTRTMVYSTGTVFWAPPTQLRSTCKIDVTYFPFDSQYCYLKFGSWSYHGLEVDVTNKTDKVDLSSYLISGEFDLVSVNLIRRSIFYPCCSEPYPDVVFFFHIRRKILYYMLNVVFPCIMMSVLTLLVFCLPPDSGEKIALGITVLLAFSVNVITIAEKMPETSDAVPLIGIYLTLVMGITGISVAMTVMVLNYHHRGPFHKQVPNWARWFILNKMRRFLGMTAKSKFSHRRESRGALHPMRTSISREGLRHEVLEPSLSRPPRPPPPTPALHSRFMQNNNNSQHLTPSPNLPMYKALNSTAVPGYDNAADDPLFTGKVDQISSNESSSQDEVLETLQMLISRQQVDDENEEVAGEWRQVAQVVDRILFWIFLGGTLSATVVMLIFIPLIKNSGQTEAFDLSKYGLPM